MKVKVAYTIDYDDVPELLEGLLSSIKEGLADCSQRLKIKPNDLDRMVEDFQQSRSRLEVIDSQIQDILQITVGWLDAGREAQDNAAQENVNPEELIEETD
tara:strand:+ start:79 stop:381 length:303 start_codon:yes stop_codon:yes gene_type:complete